MDNKERLKSIIYTAITESGMRPGQKIKAIDPKSRKTLSGTIQKDGPHGHYSKKLDAYWVEFDNGVERYVPSEQLLDEQLHEILTNSSKSTLNEELSTSDYREIRDFIRKEVAAIFFDLFKKRQTWI